MNVPEKFNVLTLKELLHCKDRPTELNDFIASCVFQAEGIAPILVATNADVAAAITSVFSMQYK